MRICQWVCYILFVQLVKHKIKLQSTDLHLFKSSKHSQNRLQFIMHSVILLGERSFWRLKALHLQNSLIWILRAPKKPDFFKSGFFSKIFNFYLSLKTSGVLVVTNPIPCFLSSSKTFTSFTVQALVINPKDLASASHVGFFLKTL